MTLFSEADQEQEDQEILASVLDHEKLTQQEREAFEDIQGRNRELTLTQRAWIKDVKRQLEQWDRDTGLLQDVLSREDLREGERTAFSEMLDLLEWKFARRLLTSRQREWLQSVATRLGVHFDSPRTPVCILSKKNPPYERRTKLLPWEQPGYVKPLKPPGRR